MLGPFNFLSFEISRYEIIQLCVFVVFWHMITTLMNKYIKEPKQIIQLKEEHDYIKARNQYYLTYKSLIHSTYAALIGLYFVLNYSLTCSQTNTQFETLILSISYSYFVYDTILDCYYNVLSPMLIAHHAIVLIACFFPLAYRRYGTESIYAMLITEISGPFYHLRSILPFIGSDLLKKVNDIVFMVVFTIARTVVISPVMRQTQYDKNAPLLFKLQQFGLWYLSLIWCWQIANSAAKILKEDIFPGWGIFRAFYGFMRYIRKFWVLFYIIALIYTSRFLIDSLQISSLPVQIFG